MHEEDRVIAALCVRWRRDNGLHFLRAVRADLEVVRHKLYPVGGGARRGSGRGEDFLVLLVVPEIRDLNVHVHGRIAGIDGGEIKLERNAGLKVFPHLPGASPSDCARALSRQSSQADQPAEQADKTFRGFDSSSSLLMAPS